MLWLRSFWKRWRYKNSSGLEPQGHAVLLRMVEVEGLRPTVIAIPAHVRQNAAIMEQRALVIAVGREAWIDEKTPRAAPGDRVIITKLAGYITEGPADGKLYRLVNDRDIFCKITKENRHG